MSASVLVAILGVIATLVAVGWIMFHRKDPENAASHTDRPVAGSTLMFGDENDRPGDPGSESMAVPRPGEPGPAQRPTGDPSGSSRQPPYSSTYPEVDPDVR
jgi:hypothetical protein